MNPVRVRPALGLVALCVGLSHATSPVDVPEAAKTMLHRQAILCDAKAVKQELKMTLKEDRRAEVNYRDKRGYTPLDIAAENGCLEVAKILVDAGATFDAADPQTHLTPLMRAAKGHQEDVVRFLVAHGADVGADLRALLEKGVVLSQPADSERADIQAIIKDREAMLKEREEMLEEIQRLQSEVQRLKDQLEAIRREAGNGQIRPQ